MSELPTGTVTLLFTDIEGSTRLLQHLGERYADVLAECRQVLRTVFQQWHGHEVDTQGDSFFVAFARTSDAVAAAIAAQRALVSRPWPDGVTISVRMGVHTGEPIRTAEGYVGLDVHHAARIMSAGHGGQVLLSHTTRELVEQTLPDGVSLRDLGAHRLKDLHQPCQLVQLVISGLPADFPPLKTLDNSPNNLPLQPTPFLGREKEVDAVGQLLRREGTRLVTLTGPGGVGKTRLALQVAAELSEHFPDGTWFVSLAPIRDPDLVLPTISQVLGLREARDQAPLEHLKYALQGKKTLLLLDNFEQVVSAALSVADLLAGCPRLKVLVTSREGLHLRAEREFPVPVLALPDPRHLPDLLSLSQYEAVALFIERAQAVTPQFQVSNSTAPAVAEICVRLDGLPLAIELAAARIRLFPPQALLTRLTQRLPLLTSSTRDVPARQQTLRSTITWSYDLLTADEQRLFRLLSVFVMGCTLEAAESVSAALGDTLPPVLDRVASLIDKNLLLQRAQEGAEPRLTMLETIREFGVEGLSTSGEMEAARQAHAAYYLHLAEEAEPALKGPHQVVWLKRLERELYNLRAALSWGLSRGQARERIEMALRLGASLWYFWAIRAHVREGGTVLLRALERAEGSALPVRAKALWVAGFLVGWLGDFERGEALCQQSLALCRESGDVAGAGCALLVLGQIGMWKTNLAAARSWCEASLAASTEVGDKHVMAVALYTLATVDYDQGHYIEGHSHAEASLLLFRELGDTWRIAHTLKDMAHSFLNEGGAEQAHPLLEESRALFRELGNTYFEGLVLSDLGLVAFHQGKMALAHALLEESLTHLQAEHELNIRGDKARALAYLAQVVAFEGDAARARALYEQCLVIARKTPYQWPTPFYLEGLAGVVAAQGELPWAARLWGAAEALRDAMGTPIPPASRADYERSVAAARTQLGEQACAAAWAQGRGMTLDQVLAAQGQALITTPAAVAPAAPAPMKAVATSPAGLTAREVECQTQQKEMSENDGNG